MKVFYTSYYASKLWRDLPNVAISRSTPTGYDGKKELVVAPSAQLLSAYKSMKISFEDFTDRYFNQLVPQDIAALVERTPDGTVFLCWEKGLSCHRHLLAEVIRIYTGIPVLELTPELKNPTKFSIVTDSPEYLRIVGDLSEFAIATQSACTLTSSDEFAKLYLLLNSLTLSFSDCKVITKQQLRTFIESIGSARELAAKLNLDVAVEILERIENYIDNNIYQLKG